MYLSSFRQRQRGNAAGKLLTIVLVLGLLGLGGSLPAEIALLVGMEPGDVVRGRSQPGSNTLVKQGSRGLSQLPAARPPGDAIPFRGSDDQSVDPLHCWSQPSRESRQLASSLRRNHSKVNGWSLQ